MDIYEYKGRNKRGEVLKGSIESPSSQAVATWMLNVGIAPIAIRRKSDRLKEQPKWLQTLQQDPLGTRELLLFTRQMWTMAKAGVPIMQALAGIQKSTSNQRLHQLIAELRNDLDKGIELSGAMSQHPGFFDDYYVNMVKVGEGTGRLEEIFQRLHAQIEFEKQMKSKINGALRYPGFVMIAIVIAMTIMTMFVIPTFAKLYKSFHAELPMLTRLLLSTSDFVVHYWWLVFGMVAAAVYAFRLYTKQPAGRYAWDKFKLKIPVAGRIIKKASLARFSRGFATAYKSGVPLVQAFTLVSRVVDNAYYEARILSMRDGVERGESILLVAQSAGIFTPLELQMLAVGEETGDIDGMLTQVAEMYQEEVEYEVERLGASIEPILLTFIGALVLIMMLGVFLPMWQLGSTAMHH